jgi:hypothetical protein
VGEVVGKLRGDFCGRSRVDHRQLFKLPAQMFKVGRSIHPAIIAIYTEGPVSCFRFVT